MPTIEAVQDALRARSSTANLVVLSLSIDEQNGRSRVELGRLETDFRDPSTSAIVAAKMLRRSFGRALGAIRIDIYRGTQGTSDAGALLATHGDFLTDRMQQRA